LILRPFVKGKLQKTGPELFFWPPSAPLLSYTYSLVIAKVITPAKIKNRPTQPLIIIKRSCHHFKIAITPKAKKTKPKTTFKNVEKTFLVSQHFSSFLISFAISPPSP